VQNSHSAGAQIFNKILDARVRATKEVARKFEM
jgi:hypothetical protein